MSDDAGAGAAAAAAASGHYRGRRSPGGRARGGGRASEEQRRAFVRERNKLHARQSRARRKQGVEQLEALVSQLLPENERLRRTRGLPKTGGAACTAADIAEAVKVRLPTLQLFHLNAGARGGGGTDGGGGGGATVSEGRRAFQKEKNKIHARLSRQRKKIYLASLQYVYTALLRENAQLATKPATVQETKQEPGSAAACTGIKDMVIVDYYADPARHDRRRAALTAVAAAENATAAASPLAAAGTVVGVKRRSPALGPGDVGNGGGGGGAGRGAGTGERPLKIKSKMPPHGMGPVRGPAAPAPPLGEYPSVPLSPGARDGAVAGAVASAVAGAVAGGGEASGMGVSATPVLATSDVMRLNERLRRENLALRARLHAQGVPVQASLSGPSFAAIAHAHGLPAGALQPPFAAHMQAQLLRQGLTNRQAPARKMMAGFAAVPPGLLIGPRVQVPGVGGGATAMPPPAAATTAVAVATGMAAGAQHQLTALPQVPFPRAPPLQASPLRAPPPQAPLPIAAAVTPPAAPVPTGVLTGTAPPGIRTGPRTAMASVE